MQAQIRVEEVEISAVRSQGAGGQNVNKVASAAHLRYDVARSSLPERVKARLLASGDRRVSAGGVVIIKAQRFRSFDRNRDDAIKRLQLLVDKYAAPVRRRIPTRPSKAAKQRRLNDKAHRSVKKSNRRRIDD